MVDCWLSFHSAITWKKVFWSIVQPYLSETKSLQMKLTLLLKPDTIWKKLFAKNSKRCHAHPMHKRVAVMRQVKHAIDKHSFVALAMCRKNNSLIWYMIWYDIDMIWYDGQKVAANGMVIMVNGPPPKSVELWNLAKVKEHSRSNPLGIDSIEVLPLPIYI